MSVPDRQATQRFYDDLAQGRVQRGLWGYDSRFEPTRVAQKPSVQRHFLATVASYVRADHVVVDVGCGPGGFLSLVAPLCREIIGVDIGQAFIDVCGETIQRAGLANARAIWSPDGGVPMPDATADVVIMVDTLHHCDDAAATLLEVHRVLAPEGRLLIFEPNKLNPALAAMCAVDRNEWGLLTLGSHRAYRRLLTPRFEIERSVYSGLLVGPESPRAVAVADLVSSDRWRWLLGWLSPKMFIVARRARTHGA